MQKNTKLGWIGRTGCDGWADTEWHLLNVVHCHSGMFLAGIHTLDWYIMLPIRWMSAKNMSVW